MMQVLSSEHSTSGLGKRLKKYVKHFERKSHEITIRLVYKMSEKQPLIIDFTKKDDVMKIVPRLPLRSSENLGWNGIHVQQHCQPAWEAPESANTTHIVVVGLDSDLIQTERWFDGRRQQEQIGGGNNIAIVPAMVPHRSNWNQEASFSLLSLEPDRLARIAYESVTTEQVELIPHYAMQDTLIDLIGKSLTMELIEDRFGSQLLVDSLTIALSIHLLRNYSDWHKPLRAYTGGLPQRKLKQAIAYIQDHLAENLTIAAIADELEMSQYYFSRLFKQAIGVSPYRYVMEQRIEAAKYLLKKTPLPISAISERVGFANQNQLTIQFYNLTGTTPSNYRKQL
jgi:AraC family transcriptional regulator